MQSLDHCKLALADESVHIRISELECAVKFGRLDIVEYLISIGTPPYDGNMPIDSIRSGNLDLFIYLLNHQSIDDDLGDALGFAALQENPDIFNYMFQRFTFTKKDLFEALYFITYDYRSNNYSGWEFVESRIKHISSMI